MNIISETSESLAAVVPANITMRAPCGANMGHFVGPMWATHVGHMLFCPWVIGGAHVGWPMYILGGPNMGPMWAT